MLVKRFLLLIFFLSILSIQNFSFAEESNEKVIKFIVENGINSFDVASINEIKLIKKILPQAHTYYMNTIKSREHIKEAYFNYNVRDFALDTKEELQKIIETTNNAKDLIL